jgi:hypothetical protein
MHIYRDIIEYCDNFLDNNRQVIFLISPNPSRVSTQFLVFPISTRVDITVSQHVLYLLNVTISMQLAIQLMSGLGTSVKKCPN